MKNVNRKQRKNLQVRHICLAKQIDDSTRLSENLAAIQRLQATTARIVEEPEVLIGCAAEHRERGQRQARRDLRVYGVREADSPVAPAGGARAQIGTNWIAHRLVNR